jgi:oxalate decarboxylase/phosphoglucose isomerase-like protein (cupin superfamily)
VEPHYHQNAAELVYCISGAAVVSILNPFTKQILNYPITPGLAANVTQGWWHYEIAAADHTHLLSIFDAPTPEVILGSDILKFTPSNIMAHTYCLDENQWKKAAEPIKPSTYIGPYKNCGQERAGNTKHTYHQNYPHQPYGQSYAPAGYYTGY